MNNKSPFKANVNLICDERTLGECANDKDYWKNDASVGKAVTITDREETAINIAEPTAVGGKKSRKKLKKRRRPTKKRRSKKRRRSKRRR